jgi:hypothetical protein
MYSMHIYITVGEPVLQKIYVRGINEQPWYNTRMYTGALRLCWTVQMSESLDSRSVDTVYILNSLTCVQSTIIIKHLYASGYFASKPHYNWEMYCLQYRVPNYESPEGSFEIRDSRFEIPDARFQIRDSRCEIPDARCEMRDARCEIPDSCYPMKWLLIFYAGVSTWRHGERK